MNEWIQQLVSSLGGDKPYGTKMRAELSPRFEGMHMPGNIDLTNRPVVYNPETGGHSTVWSMGIGLDDGKEALIPRVSNDGKILSEKEAIEQFKNSRQHLGIFHSKEAANDYAEYLHKEQAKLYGRK
jgi:hypothetical protein